MQYTGEKAWNSKLKLRFFRRSLDVSISKDMKNIILISLLFSFFFVMAPQQINASQKAPAEAQKIENINSHSQLSKSGKLSKKDILSLLKKKKKGKRTKDNRYVNPFAKASFILGIASILFLVGAFLPLAIAGLFGTFWFLSALTGIILGIIGLVQIQRYYDEFTGREYAVVGIILSSVSLAIPILIGLLVLLLFF